MRAAARAGTRRRGPPRPGRSRVRPLRGLTGGPEARSASARPLRRARRNAISTRGRQRRSACRTSRRGRPGTCRSRRACRPSPRAARGSDAFPARPRGPMTRPTASTRPRQARRTPRRARTSAAPQGAGASPSSEAPSVSVPPRLESTQRMRRNRPLSRLRENRVRRGKERVARSGATRRPCGGDRPERAGLRQPDRLAIGLTRPKAL